MIRKLTIFLAGVSFALSLPLAVIAQNMSVLKPPPGAHVAIYEFADLECPMCARENPLLKSAAAKYHIPWLRHDFPLPMHNWSFQAAVNARWFDEQPKHLGNDYRDAIFANQSSIETKNDLAQFTQKFAQQHGIALPFVLDPQGRLAAEVKADANLGQELGVNETPTVWIVTDRTNGAAPYTRVTDFDNLYRILDDAVDQTGHK
ncbi:MAG TPA: thioredoxin domain-containing protein [Acidobacteriaceae bacterium]|jgi:protein-disulfide isomerase|nr:thioredoxin domain-containing protein [Acidobacteriaceae bacterium]